MIVFEEYDTVATDLHSIVSLIVYCLRRSLNSPDELSMWGLYSYLSNMNTHTLD